MPRLLRRELGARIQHDLVPPVLRLDLADGAILAERDGSEPRRLELGLVLLVGRRIERTLEILNWIMIVAILGTFVTLALLFVAQITWARAAAWLPSRYCPCH